MREIKFRGKRTDNGGWVYGKLIEMDVAFIVKSAMWEITGDIVSLCCTEVYEVDPETVGQCTGLRDYNGTDIYEGDIVIVNYGLKDRKENVINEQNCKGYLAIIKFEDGMFTHGWWEPVLNGECLYVIGNIHDNPELLEVE